MKIGEIFRQRRTELKLTLQQVADEVETDAGNLSRFERGEQGMSEELMFSIAKLLNLSIEFRPSLHVAETGAAYVVDSERVEVATNEIPIVGTTTGGTGGYWEELGYPQGHGDGHLEAASHDRNAYALRVQGNSMSPRMFEGEYILVEPNHACHPGDEVVVQTKDGQIMVKMLVSRRNGQITLGSISNDERLVFNLDELHAMHYVAGVFRAGSVRHKV